MKKCIAFALILLIALSYVPFASANYEMVGDVGIYAFKIRNCVMHGMSYDNKTVRFDVEYDEGNPTNKSIGLGLLEILFKPEKAPETSGIGAAMNTSLGTLDMLREVSFIKGDYLWQSVTVEVVMVRIFIFLFANRSIANETSILPDWDDFTPKSGLSLGLSVRPPVVVSISFGSVPVVSIVLGASIALVAVLVVLVYRRRHTHS